MDSETISQMVTALQQLGDASLTGFIVWVVADLVSSIVVAGTIVGCVGLIITKVVSAIESASNHDLKRIRDNYGTGAPGPLTSRERFRTLALIEKALIEYKTNHPEERKERG